MTAAFPSSAPSASPVAGVRLIPQRQEFVPPWCPWVTGAYEGADKTIVRWEGEPVEPTFTVAEMLPERRWCVRQDGELLGILEFREAYQRKLRDWFLYASEEAKHGAGRVPASLQIHREPVPHPARYAAMEVDPRVPGDPQMPGSGRTRQMGFDPSRKADPNAPKRLWNSEEERFLEGHERMNALVRQYRSEQAGGAVKLRTEEREEVERHLSGLGAQPGQPVGDDTAVKLRTLAELHRDGDLSDAAYIERVNAIVGVKEDPNEDPDYLPKGYSWGACGEKVLNLKIVKHRAECEPCRIAYENEPKKAKRKPLSSGQGSRSKMHCGEIVANVVKTKHLASCEMCRVKEAEAEAEAAAESTSSKEG